VAAVASCSGDQDSGRTGLREDVDSVHATSLKALRNFASSHRRIASRHIGLCRTTGAVCIGRPGGRVTEGSPGDNENV